MRVVSALEVRARFGQVVDEAASGERIVIERAGQPVAAIVSLADLEALDPGAERERRLAALAGLVRSARRHASTTGLASPAELIRAERDRGHTTPAARADDDPRRR